MPPAPPSSLDGARPDVKDDLGSRIETARQSRALTITLGGTCVAIFTFLLFFLYPRLVAGEVSPVLFRLSFGAVIGSLFLLVYGATFYFWALLDQEKGGGNVKRLILRGDWCFAIATVFLVAAPVLILYTINLPDLATVALALWVVHVGLLFGGTWKFMR